MKKIWVLEERSSVDELKKQLFDFFDFVDSLSEEARATYNPANAMMDLEERIEDNPQGIFQGRLGRENYKAFCNDVKEYILLNCISRRADIRIYTAEIEDDATTWKDYKRVERKEGVEKFIFATLNERE